jgi:hypothetical protein
VIVPRIRTPFPLADLLDELDAAGHEVLVTCPGPDRIATAWAQLVLEHGRTAPQAATVPSLRGLYCYNFGNRDAPHEAATDPAVPCFATVPECEGTACGWRATHLRYAYPDANAGLVAWWRSMVERWQAVEEMAEPAAFAARLKQAGYYTGSEAEYAASLVELAAEGRRMWGEGHGGGVAVGQVRGG